MFPTLRARRAAARFVNSQRSDALCEAQARTRQRVADQRKPLNERPASPVCATEPFEASESEACTATAEVAAEEAAAAPSMPTLAPSPSAAAKRARAEAIEKMRQWHAERDATLPTDSVRLALVARGVTSLHGERGRWETKDDDNNDGGWEGVNRHASRSRATAEMATAQTAATTGEPDKSSQGPRDSRPDLESGHQFRGDELTVEVLVIHEHDDAVSDDYDDSSSLTSTLRRSESSNSIDGLVDIEWPMLDGLGLFDGDTREAAGLQSSAPLGIKWHALNGVDVPFEVESDSNDAHETVRQNVLDDAPEHCGVLRIPLAWQQTTTILL